MTSPYDNSDPWGDDSNVASGGTSTDLALPTDYDTGLDDLGSDLAIPRLKILHKEGVFSDPSDNSKYAEIHCIILGLSKQRVLFDAKVDPNNPEKPMCKSPDTVTGYPNMNPENAKKGFPWTAAKLDVRQAGRDKEGRVTIACSTCFLADWDSHPLGGKPWCSEQFVLPILFATSLEQLKAGDHTPALIAMQKTGIKPTKAYLKTFQLRKLGAYTAYTKLNLLMERTGDNVFSKPVFTREGDTDRGDWLDYIEQFRAIEGFLKSQKPPAPDVDDAQTDNAREVLASTATAAQQNFTRPAMGQQTVATVVAPAQAPIDVDDNLPF